MICRRGIRPPPPSPTGGVTLIEILVTMVVSSVVLMGVGTIFSGAASDFTRWNRIREARYGRGLLETELFWTMRSVPPEGYRPGTWGDAIINDGVAGRTVLTYDYVRNHQGSRVNASSFSRWTGIVYQYGSVVYRFQDDRDAGMTGQPQNSFNLFSTGQLQTFCSSLANRRASDVLATGVDSLAFTREARPAGVSVSWTLRQF